MELTVNLTTKLLVDTTESLLSSIYSELLPRDDMSLAFALHFTGKEFGYVPTCNRRLLETAGFRSLQKTAREAEATRNRSQLDLTLAIRQAEGHSASMPEPRS